MPLLPLLLFAIAATIITPLFPRYVDAAITLAFIYYFAITMLPRRCCYAIRRHSPLYAMPTPADAYDKLQDDIIFIVTQLRLFCQRRLRLATPLRCHVSLPLMIRQIFRF